VSPAPSSFSFEPLYLALVVVAAVLYGRAARAERAPAWRVVLYSLGLLLVAGALNSPLETIAVNYLLLFHLLQNVMIADWAPPGGRVCAALTDPKVALPMWLVSWYAIHLALLYDFALRHAWTLNIEHALLIAIGFLFWWPVLADEPREVGAPVKIGYLGAAFVGSVFLGLGLTFATTPFYDFYAQAPRLWGLSAEKDQNFGGILMNVEQSLVFLAAILYFVVKLIPEEERFRADA
jgi:cytochrome c oxidase assembly factor CtaG